MDMIEENIIVLKSAYNKTQGQVYFIQPCIDPKTGLYPDCIREVSDVKTHQMILSDADKAFISQGGVLLPATKPIEVSHGKTFNLNDPLQKAQWEAIKNSVLIAPDRLAKNSKGDYLVDGERPYRMDNGVIGGKYGSADLYVEHPGLVSKNKNERRKLVVKAQNLIIDDTIEGWLTKCKLLEKDMSHANANDVEDYLFTQAERYPEKIIELYTGSTTAIRLLIISALDKGVVVKRSGLLIYSDDIVLGTNVDSAVAFLSDPDRKIIKDQIQKETFPDLYKKKTPLELAREAKEKKKAEETNEED